MALRAAQIPTVLGGALENFWLPGGAARRTVSCVTLVRQCHECRSCHFGELVVLTRDAGGLAAVEEAIATAVEHDAAAILVADVPYGAHEHARLRALSDHLAVAVGLLGAHVDPHLAANTLSRALAGAEVETPQTPLRGIDSLQELVDMLGRLLGNSVTIESANHELLVFSAMDAPVDRVREETILRRTGQAEALKWVVREGYINRVRRSERPVRVPPNPALGFTGRTAMRVMAEGEILAIIWATETARSLSADDENLLVEAAEAAGGILLRQREALQREARVRAEFLDDVIQGRISNPESVRALAGSVGWDIDRPQQALVVEIDRLEEFRLRHTEQGGQRRSSSLWSRVRERLTEIVRLEALALDPDAIVGQRGTGVIVLVSPNYTDPERRAAAAARLAEAVVQRVPGLIPGMTITVGVGREFGAFEHIAESVREAELAARLGASLFGGNRATRYSDLGIHRALFALQEHEEMITPALQRIIEHDERHGSDYVQSLAVYLACMGRLRVAAEQLNIHRNTLEYRMRRIEEVAGISLEDPNSRLALELGIRLLEMKRASAAVG